MARFEMLALYILNFLFLKEKRDSTKTLWLSGCSLQQSGDFIVDESETYGSNFLLKYTLVWQLKENVYKYSRFGGHQPCKKGVAQITITIY